MCNRLTTYEESRIKNFISIYKEYSQKVKKSEADLEYIEKKKGLLLKDIQILMENLNRTREEEESYVYELVSKYGEFTLDFETFAMEIHKNKKQ